MSNILITGAAGFIGSQLAARLYKNGDRLTLVDDFSYGHYDNLKTDTHDFTEEIIRCDITDKDMLKSVFDDNGPFDYIYNIAGIAPLPDCQSDPVRAVEVNIGGFVNVLDNARRTGCRVVIQASTNAMYENETEFPTHEDTFNLPTLIYPNTKYCAERFAQSYADTYGLSVICLRFANVYGPHIDCIRKQPPFVGYMIRELFYNRTPVFHSDGEQRDYIYVDDLIDLAVKVQKGSGFDCVNVSSGKSYSVNELYSIAQDIMHTNISPEYSKETQYWKKYPTLYSGALKIKDSVLKHEVNKYSRCDYSHANSKYGWSPKTNIKDGLKKS